VNADLNGDGAGTVQPPALGASVRPRAGGRTDGAQSQAPADSVPGETSRVAPTLIAAYRATHYCVNGVSPPFLLKIDEANSDLAACHREYGVDSSAFLTAWNPGSRATSDEENQSAQQELRAALEARGFAVLEGLGIDPAGQWAGEESLLVLGIGCDAAAELGRAFRQHGIVWSGRDSVPRLILLE
jgi:hypothetical protein